MEQIFQSRPIGFIICRTWAILLTLATCSASVPRDLSRYHCDLTLPGGSWTWRDSSQIPPALGLARDTTGNLLLVLAFPQSDDYAICDDLIKGFEDSFLRSAKSCRISGRKLTFQGVPCYELRTCTLDEKHESLVRVFSGHGFIYEIQIICPKGSLDGIPDKETLFASFRFTEQPALRLRPDRTTSKKAYAQGVAIGTFAGYASLVVIACWGVAWVMRNLQKRKS